jgi:hypothetical protein
LKDNKPGFLRKLLRYTLLLLNVGSVVWIALCALAAVKSPLEVSHLALVTLTTPFAIIANVLFVFIWLFTSKKIRSLFSVFTLVKTIWPRQTTDCA